MQLQVRTRVEGDGVDASVPSIRECETWARSEDEALERLLERVAYFLRLPVDFEHRIDLQRREDGETWYTLVLPDANSGAAPPIWHERSG
jgi:hypothetical protein